MVLRLGALAACAACDHSGLVKVSVTCTEMTLVQFGTAAAVTYSVTLSVGAGVVDAVENRSAC